MKSILLRLAACIALISCFAQRASAQISFISIDLMAKSLKYDGKRDKIYATVNSLDTAYGNTLVQINPHTGVIENSVFVGSNPNVMALTKDTNYVYVGCDGASFVKRVDLATFSVDRTIGLGTSIFGAMVAGDLATSYQSPDMVIVARKNPGISPSFAGVVAYKGTTLLPGQIAWTASASNVIQSPIDTNLVFGYENETSNAAFNVMKADTAAGITLVSATNNMYMGKHIRLEKHLIYSDGGRIVDPYLNLPTFTGTLSGLGPDAIVIPDTATNRVYFVQSEFTGSSSGYDLLIRRYNIQSQTFIDETHAPVIPSNFELAYPLDAIRYGQRGMAVIVNQDYVVNQARVVLFETCLVEPGTDLSVQMLHTPDKIYVGDTATFSLIVKNEGALTAQHIVTTDTFNSSFHIIGSSVANGVADTSNGIFSWVLDSLTTGQADTAFLTVAFSQTGVFPNLLNTASNTFDCGLGNNTSATPLDIRDTGCFHMAIDFSGNDTFFFINTQATLHWHITNDGTVKGRGIVLTDTLENGVLYNSGGSASAGNLSADGNVVVYTLDTLAAGQSVDVNVVVYFNGSGTFIDKVNLLTADNILCDSDAVYTFAYSSGSSQTSIHKVQEAEAFKIYPNPATNRLSVQFEYSGHAQSGLMQIKDIVGKTILSEQTTLHQGSNRQNIDISRMPKGVYMLQFNAGNENQYFKFVKE